jgi:hypothetical protein
MTEDARYTGDMSESDYKRMKIVGKVAQAAGGAVWALGGQRESNVGGIAGLGGVVADLTAGKGYTGDMKFRCQ